VPTINEEIHDAALRRATAVRRFANGEFRSALSILNDADRELNDMLRRRLAGVAGRPISRQAEARLKSVLASVRELRQAVMVEIRQRTTASMQDLSRREAAFEQASLAGTIPIQLTVASASADSLRALVTSRPFDGDVLSGHFRRLSRLDQGRIERAIRVGVLSGESTEEILRRVAGSRARQYADGVQAATRSQLEGLVRTAVTHVSNAARNEVWSENSDILQGLKWTSTLDGRTSPICRANDGKVFPIDSGPRPPAHFNCRSIMVPVLDGEAVVGERPFVRSAARPDERLADFRATAKEQAGDSWADMTPAARSRATARVRSAWTAENVGQVPSDVTYSEWLGRQPTEFQNEVLGTRRAQMFRSGELSLDRMVDRAGNEIPLSQL